MLKNSNFPLYNQNGSDTNPFQVKPSYTFWAPYVGPNCKKGANLVNSEFHKANHKEDLETLGARPEDLTIEKVMDLFCEGKVCCFKTLVMGGDTKLVPTDHVIFTILNNQCFFPTLVAQCPSTAICNIVYY